MPRIHSWREVIAPRDCWCILHRTTLRPAEGPPPVPPAASNPHRVPLGFHHPLHPPGGTSNEQFHYCLTPVINLHGRPLALPPPACAHPPSLPPATLSSFSPLFHLFSPKDSTITRTTPHFVSCFLGSISLHYVSSLLSSAPSLYLFSLYPAFLSPHCCLKKEKKKWRMQRVPILHYFRHCLRKNNDEGGGGVSLQRPLYQLTLHHFLFFFIFLLAVFIRLPIAF